MKGRTDIMFIYTFKASSIKFFAVLLLSVFALVVFVSVTSDYANQSNTVTAFSDAKLSTNEDRVNFLKANGIIVEGSPCEIIETVVPEKFDSVYQEYNNIQMSQGFDLEKYKGKEVTRYSYIIMDDTKESKTIASIILHKNRIIACDICNTEGEGYVSALIK